MADPAELPPDLGADRDGDLEPTRLADELRFLAAKYPRASWDSDLRLGETARFWLQRHAMFRKLDELLRSGTDAAALRLADPDDFKRWFARHLNLFLSQLEEHHHIEDHHYFPVFRAAEGRLVAGFDLLENDHAGIHVAIGGIVDTANTVLTTPPAEFGPAVARFRDEHIRLGRRLIRHLDDEEDLIIPLLIDRGEAAVLGG